MPVRGLRKGRKGFRDGVVGAFVEIVGLGISVVDAPTFGSEEEVFSAIVMVSLV